VSSYDPPHQPWRRRSRDDSRRNWRANRRRRPRRQQRRHRPQRRPTRCRKHHPLRLWWRWLPKHRQSRQQPHQRHQQLSRRHSPRRRRLRDQACRETPAKPRLPLGLVRRQVPHRGHGPGPPEDCRARQLRGVLVLRGQAITRSPPRKEWVSPARRVLAETALDLRERARPPAAPRQRQAVAQELRECRDLTRR
jgi:hypothetical protein